MARTPAFIFSLLLALTLASGAAGAQDSAAQPGDAARGQLLYEKHCRRCHKAEPLARRLYPQGVAAAQRDLCRFLQAHRRGDEARDCAIVTYLESLAPAPPKSGG